MIDVSMIDVSMIEGLSSKVPVGAWEQPGHMSNQNHWEEKIGTKGGERTIGSSAHNEHRNAFVLF